MLKYTVLNHEFHWSAWSITFEHFLHDTALNTQLEFGLTHVFHWSGWSTTLGPTRPWPKVTQCRLSTGECCTPFMSSQSLLRLLLLSPTLTLLLMCCLLLRPSVSFLLWSLYLLSVVCDFMLFFFFFFWKINSQSPCAFSTTLPLKFCLSLTTHVPLCVCIISFIVLSFYSLFHYVIFFAILHFVLPFAFSYFYVFRFFFKANSASQILSFSGEITLYFVLVIHIIRSV